MSKIVTNIASALGFAQKTPNKFVSLDNDDFAKILADKDAQLVDVRTPSEYSDGHIPRAVNIDVYSPTFQTEISKLDKSLPVAIYCRSGTRSVMAANQVANDGFTVFNLTNGIMGWNGDVVV